MQLKTLVTVAHSIFEEYNTEAIKHKEKPKLLNGDDFSPYLCLSWPSQACAGLT